MVSWIFKLMSFFQSLLALFRLVGLWAQDASTRRQNTDDDFLSSPSWGWVSCVKCLVALTGQGISDELLYS